MSLLKSLVKQSATYGVSSILGRIINFLLVPFYTNPSWTGIDLKEFGIYSELYAYMAFLNIIYLFGMETTFFRFSTKENMLKDEVYNSSESVIFTTSLFFSSLLILLSGPISELLNYPEKRAYIILLSLILAVDAIVAIPFAKLRLENKAKSFAIFKLINIFLNVFFNIFFLYFCWQVHLGKLFPVLKPVIELIYIPDFQVGYIIVSNLLANTLQIPFLWSSFKNLRFHINFKILREMFKYSYPLMFMGLAGMVNEVLDRILLRVMLPHGFYPGKSTLEAIGIYGACYKLSMFMSLAIQAFRYAADPFFFSHSKEENSFNLFAVIMKYFIISCTIIYVLVGANLQIFGLILRSPAYREGLIIVPFLLLANLFLGIYINLAAWYKLTDKTYAGTVITFIGAGITVGANIILIPILGYLGAAIATLLCYAGMAMVGYFWGQKHFPVPYNVFSAVAYLTASSAIVWISIEYIPFTGPGRSIMGIAFTLLYIIAIVLIEKNNLRKDLRQM